MLGPEFVENLKERAFVPWFAVNDHAVHVEDDGLEMFQFGGVVRGG
jgi:hypothetical protein